MDEELAASYKTLVQLLSDDALRILCNDLLFTSSDVLTGVSFHGVVDDLQNTTLGYSFLTDERNDFGALGLLVDIAGNLKHRGADIPPTALRHYSLNVHKFLSYLLLLVLLTGGQPDLGAAGLDGGGGRSELVFFSHSNVANSFDAVRCYRMLSLWQGKFCIITTAYTTIGGSGGGPASRARFLPDVLDAALALYLVSVRPFHKRLVPNNPLNNSGYLFANEVGVWHTENYKNSLKRESLRRVGREISIEDVNRIYADFNRARGFADDGITPLRQDGPATQG